LYNASKTGTDVTTSTDDEGRTGYLFDIPIASFSARGGGGGTRRGVRAVVPEDFLVGTSGSNPCFYGTTLIRMADRMYKRADQIKLGDLVALGARNGVVPNANEVLAKKSSTL
jgi:hypothetical protein